MSQDKSKLSRRTLFVGAGAAGAAATVATLVPLAPQAPTPQQTLQAPPDKGGGYQLTQHVQQYYKTTRL